MLISAPLKKIEVLTLPGNSSGIHDDVVLLMPLNSAVTVRTGSASTELLKGDLAVIGPLTQYYISGIGGSGLSIVHCTTECLHNINQGELVIIKCGDTNGKNDTAEIRGCFLDMIKHYTLTSRISEYAIGKFYEFMFHFNIYIQIIRREKSLIVLRSNKDDDRIHKILSYVETHYNEEIRLKELAESLDISVSWLSKYFKSKTGYLLNNYITSVRLQHVLDDISRGISVTEAAYNNGFSNISTFNAAFRRKYHVSPTKYRKLNLLYPEITGNIINPTETPIDNEESKKEKNEFIPVTIDTRICEEYRKWPWFRLINAGSMSSLQSESLAASVINTCMQLNIDTVRIWNLFEYPAQAVSEVVESGKYAGCFSTIDKCLDPFVERGLAIYLETAYHGDLNYDIDRIDSAHEQPVMKAFSNIEALSSYWDAFLEHLTSRYGYNTISGWYFSIWCPEKKGERLLSCNIPGFLLEPDIMAYPKLVYKTVKKNVPEAKIVAGGFDFLYNGYRKSEKYLNAYRRAGIKPDIISMISYPYRTTVVNNRNRCVWMTDPRSMKNEIGNMENIKKNCGYESIPLWITEYNLSASSQNPLNDCRLRGAFILKNMTELSATANIEAAALNCYSDKEEGHFLLTGDYGMFTHNAIPKSAYNALFFLSKAFPCLILSTEHLFVTGDGHGAFNIIFFNYRVSDALTYIQDERELTTSNVNSIHKTLSSLEIRVTLTGLTAKTYRLRKRTVTAQFGDISAILNEDVFSGSLTAEEKIAVRSMCSPSFGIEYINARKSGSITFNIMLGPNDFGIYELVPERTL